MIEIEQTNLKLLWNGWKGCLGDHLFVRIWDGESGYEIIWMGDVVVSGSLDHIQNEYDAKLFVEEKALEFLQEEKDRLIEHILKF